MSFNATLYYFYSWVLCRVGSTGRPIKLFLNNVPRGCRRLPNGSGDPSRYEIPNESDENALSNVMKDQPMISSAGRTSKADLVPKNSE